MITSDALDRSQPPASLQETENFSFQKACLFPGFKSSKQPDPTYNTIFSFKIVIITNFENKTPEIQDYEMTRREMER